MCVWGVCGVYVGCLWGVCVSTSPSYTRPCNGVSREVAARGTLRQVLRRVWGRGRGCRGVCGRRRMSGWQHVCGWRGGADCPTRLPLPSLLLRYCHCTDQHTAAARTARTHPRPAPGANASPPPPQPPTPASCRRRRRGTPARPGPVPHRLHQAQQQRRTAHVLRPAQGHVRSPWAARALHLSREGQLHAATAVGLVERVGVRDGGLGHLDRGRGGGETRACVCVDMCQRAQTSV